MKRLMLSGVAMLLGLLLILPSCMKDEAAIPLTDEQQEAITFRTMAPNEPFIAHYTTYPVIVDDTDGILTIEISSEGRSTYLGPSIWYSDSKVYTNPKLPWRQTGTMYFVSSKKDTLFGYFEGVAVPGEVNPFSGHGEYVITHGTGKFIGTKFLKTTGEGTYSYVVSPEFIGELEFIGTLTKSPRH